MAEDEAVRDLKRSLVRRESGTHYDELFRDAEQALLRSVSDPILKSLPLSGPGSMTWGNLVQPGGFRRAHVLKGQPRPPSDAAHKPLLESLLNPWLLQRCESEEKKPRHLGSTDCQTILVLLKTMIGSTLIVLPGSFRDAGLFMAPLLLATVGAAEIYCMVLLIRCCEETGGGSYGDVARRAFGKAGRLCVDASLLLSQFGFVCAEMLYVATNAHGVLRDLGLPTPSLRTLLCLQLLFTVPMSWIRRLKYFTLTNAVANATVLIAVLLLASYGVAGFAESGVASDLVLVGPGWPIFCGTVVFALEGINFVIPMYEAHEKKETFVPLLISTLSFVIVLFSVFGGANYAIYGDKTAPILTLNMPPSSIWSKVVSLAFAVASLFTVPLFLFPATLVLEGQIFHGETSPSLVRKWKKNLLRTSLLLLCTAISVIGGESIQAFISIIGSFCCVPLAFIYPAGCHLVLCRPGLFGTLLDVVFLVLGTAIFVITTALAIGTF